MSKGKGKPRPSKALKAKTSLAYIGDFDPRSWVLPVPGDGGQLLSPPKALPETPACPQLFVPRAAPAPDSSF